MDKELQRRLHAMSESSDSADWGDVLRRANGRKASSAPRRGRILLRRPRLVAAACALLVIMVVAPALAVRGDIFNFSSAEKAPVTVQKEFGSLDVGAPSGMAPRVSGQARRVLSIRTGDGGHSLWVAPTQNGGFCGQLDQLGGGCDRDRQLPFSLSIQQKTNATPVLIWGSLLLPDVASVETEYEDGHKDELALVWVSEPLDAGFYLAEVPKAREAAGLRPVAVVARDSDGDELARKQVPAIFGRR